MFYYVNSPRQRRRCKVVTPPLIFPRKLPRVTTRAMIQQITVKTCTIFTGGSIGWQLVIAVRFGGQIVECYLVGAFAYGMLFRCAWIGPFLGRNSNFNVLFRGSRSAWRLQRVKVLRVGPPGSFHFYMLSYNDPGRLRRRGIFAVYCYVIYRLVCVICGLYATIAVGRPVAIFSVIGYLWGSVELPEVRTYSRFMFGRVEVDFGRFKSTY